MGKFKNKISNFVRLLETKYFKLKFKKKKKIKQ
jgi:hypothetical protein